jgi:myo-inositol-1-phosphate synthase
MVTACPQTGANVRTGANQTWGATESGAPLHHRGDDLQIGQTQLVLSLIQH